MIRLTLVLWLLVLVCLLHTIIVWRFDGLTLLGLVALWAIATIKFVRAL